MSLRFDTRGLPPRDRSDYWLAAVQSQFMPMRIDTQADLPLEAVMTRSSVGAMHALSATGRNHVHTRSGQDVITGDPETLQVAFLTHGSSIVEQDGRQATLNTGTMVFFDSSRPYRLISPTAFNLHVWALPKSLVMLSNRQSRSITAVALSDTCGVVGVVHQFLQKSMSSRAMLEVDPEASAIGGHIANLVGTLVHSVFGKGDVLGDSSSLLYEQILTFIDTHHAESGLDPAMIAHAHHISLRKLHAVFAERHQTLMSSLRALRLRSVRDDLSNSRYAHLSLQTIARRHGFTTLSGLSRAFRSEFGTSPSHFRSTVGQVCRMTEPPE